MFLLLKSRSFRDQTSCAALFHRCRRGYHGMARPAKPLHPFPQKSPTACVGNFFVPELVQRPASGTFLYPNWSNGLCREIGGAAVRTWHAHPMLSRCTNCARVVAICMPRPLSVAAAALVPHPRSSGECHGIHAATPARRARATSATGHALPALCPATGARQPM